MSCPTRAVAEQPLLLLLACGICMPDGAMLPQKGGDGTVLNTLADAVSSPPEQGGRHLFSHSPPDRAERFEPRPEYQ